MNDRLDIQASPSEPREAPTESARNHAVTRLQSGVKRRRPKSEKELYAEAAERAELLKRKLLARRATNRDRLIEDLYRRFRIAAIEGDFDDADRLSELRSALDERLKLAAPDLR